MKQALTAGAAGLLFALGLGLGGMTDPAKVVGFLDVAGAWDPSLAFVMAGALGAYALARGLILRRAAPVLADAFPKAPSASVDGRLVAGAVLFGVGWGLSGYCPGPALVVLPVGGLTVALFVVGMVAGMGVFRALVKQPG
ncbi:DUF6691 family protein [Myxococcus faecalis]|jgi:hypothetical protein|uniref:DUF6691 family protein n=1 Tax=Myxococcus TaxID=32 RepID=UPI001CBE9B84|nr:DUF6691 family protein [Myxococcus sp. AS-1-15]MBZ4394512.1 YeeE/YedE family protein [Myxococcus sp. AS-1-15]BDT36947.1 YeeE/YedE family protein [Myxococcus sp. MH1]